MKKRTLFFGALLAGGTAFAYKKLDDSVNNIPEELKRKKSTYEFTEYFNTITISEALDSIIIKPSKDNKVHVTCYENSQYYYDILISDKLVISSRTAVDFLEKAKDLVRKDKHILIVEIPVSLKPTLVVKSRGGDLKIDSLDFIDLVAEAEHGSLVIKEVKVENVCVINNEKGTINAENIVAQCFNCVNEKGMTILYNIDVKGNVTIDNHNGGTSGYGVSTGETLNISNKNGNIELKSLEIGTEAYIYNGNGNAEISFSGEEYDYAFSAISQGQGYISIPDGKEDGKPIYVENKNGNTSVTVEW